MLVPTLASAVLPFFVGVVISARVAGAKSFLLFGIALASSVPRLIFAANYLNVFDEPIWFVGVRFRSQN